MFADGTILIPVGREEKETHGRCIEYLFQPTFYRFHQNTEKNSEIEANSQTISELLKDLAENVGVLLESFKLQ